VELLSEVPGSVSSSPSIQWDGTWLRTYFLVVVLTKSRRDCQMSCSTSPWGLSQVKTAQRLGTPGQRRTQNTIGWYTTSFNPVSLPTPMQPSHQPVTQGPSSWNQSGASKCCGNIDRWETMRHSQEWRTQILFYTRGLRHIPCLSIEQRIHRIFKRQCRASIYKECAPIN
jgi:hypothetical protein